MNSGNIDLGLLAWEQIAQIQPGSATNYYNLGLALAGKQRYQEAITQWNKALSLNPRHENSLHNLAVAYAIVRDYDAAWDTVKKLRALGCTPDALVLENLTKNTGRTE